MARKYPLVIVNTSLPLVINLTPNPNSIIIDSSKVFSETRTLGGWVFEHWGENPETMRVSGITKAMNKDNEAIVEASFFALRQMYKLDKRVLSSLLPSLKDKKKIATATSTGFTSEQLGTLSNTMIYYKWDVYKGFFTGFNWVQDANFPFIHRYSFNFRITSSIQDFLRDKILFPAGVPTSLKAISSNLTATAATILSIKGF